MGLFDNLFKAKPDAADEAVVEAARRIAEHEKARLMEASRLSPASPTARPGAVPPPKAYAPRSLGQVVTPARPSSGAVRPNESTPAQLRKIRLSAHERGEVPTEIVLTVEDVLPRIPMELISEQPPDLRRELRFKVEDLSADIARGRAAVSLGRIAEQVPELFRESIAVDDARQVRLPLQKLVEQIGFLPIKPAPATAPASASPPPGPGPALPAAPSGISEPLTPTSSNVRISLNLAEVLQNCPRDLIVAELPPIGPRDRISFPWPPIEKQLPSGYVEVSSVRFIFALPAYLQGYFEAREGVRVPLPIDEIRANLPHQAPNEPVAAPAPAPLAAIEPHSEPAPASPPLPEPPASPEVSAPPPQAVVETVSDHDAVPDVIFARAQPVTTTEPEPEAAAQLGELPAAEPAPEIEESPALAAPVLELPLPVVMHAPPPLVVESEGVEAAPSPEVAPPVDPVPSAPPEIPSPSLQAEVEHEPSHVVPPPPPSRWMQPPREMPPRPIVQWPPDVAPPPLPLHFVAPPVVRPTIAPPLVGVDFEKVQPEQPIAPPVAPPEPPRALDLEVARAALGLESDATLADIATELIRLPGIDACAIFVRHEHAQAGDLPDGIETEAARALAQRVTGAVGEQIDPLGVGGVQHCTIFAERSCVSFFARGEAIVCAFHRARAFLPGACERLAAAALSLSHA